MLVGCMAISVWQLRVFPAVHGLCQACVHRCCLCGYITGQLDHWSQQGRIQTKSCSSKNPGSPHGRQSVFFRSGVGFNLHFSGWWDVLSVTISKVGGGRLLRKLNIALVGTFSGMYLGLILKYKIVRAVSGKKQGFPHRRRLKKKLPPPLPEILVPGPPQSPDFQSFFRTTVPGISSWLSIVFIYHPHGFLWKGGNMKLIPRSTAFMSFLMQKQWGCHLHFCIYVLGLKYMPEKVSIETHHTLRKKTIAVHGRSSDFCWNSPKIMCLWSDNLDPTLV